MLEVPLPFSNRYASASGNFSFGDHVHCQRGEKFVKRVMLFLVAALFALALVGCSSNPGGNEQTNDTPPVSDTTPGTDTGSTDGDDSDAENDATPGEGQNDAEDDIATSDSFRVLLPAEGETIATPLKIKGEASVFEGSFRVMLEDGHDILAEKDVTADKGAPEWGAFEFELPFKDATSPHGMLIFSVQDAKDGSWQEDLIIPVTFAEPNLGGTP